MFEYPEETKKLINKLSSGQKEQLMQVTGMVADVIINDGIIHTFGTGYSQMIGMEMFGRACKSS
ncbi:SIS domain-containing protein [Sinomicrobium pectinilyticum]|uniref:SIS domain-containing protein n=1 Tax=Sinomicrobium pectinilyticum TaxID=1084421 RepID=A0A3N0DIL0_SINP1|nr:SIS domain-containing protein [Sinomicrobium pectinilyticum]RNL75226.1 SIS domain-containing protein [Sinomicrobium pectinilyticum]